MTDRATHGPSPSESITCRKCGVFLATAVHGRIRVSPTAVAVGKVILLCTHCGAFRVLFAAGGDKRLDSRAAFGQTDPD